MFDLFTAARVHIAMAMLKWYIVQPWFHLITKWLLLLTFALSWVVRADTFSWEASSSLRSLRILKWETSTFSKHPQVWKSCLYDTKLWEMSPCGQTGKPGTKQGKPKFQMSLLHYSITREYEKANLNRLTSDCDFSSGCKKREIRLFHWHRWKKP